MLVIDVLKQIFNKNELHTNDKLGVYPQKVHVPAFLERRYLKTSRILGLLAIISTCISIMLGSTLYILPSLASSAPVPFAYNHTLRSFDFVEDMIEHKHSNQLVMENLIREYINLRHTVVPDVDAMNLLWEAGNRFYWYNDYSIYSNFIQFEKQRILDKIKSSGYRRDVYFRWSRYFKKNMWAVEFDTYEYTGWQQQNAVRKRWRAYMVAVFDKQRKYPKEMYLLFNPLKFSVREYNLTSIEVKD